MPSKRPRRLPFGTPIKVYNGLLYSGPERRSIDRRKIKDRRALGKRVMADFTTMGAAVLGRRNSGVSGFRKLRPTDIGRSIRQEWVDFAEILHEFDSSGMVFPMPKGYKRDVEVGPSTRSDAKRPDMRALQKFLDKYGKEAAQKLFESTVQNTQYSIHWHPEFISWSSNRRTSDRRQKSERRIHKGLIKKKKI